jgi:hypothetical protein
MEHGPAGAVSRIGGRSVRGHHVEERGRFAAICGRASAIARFSTTASRPEGDGRSAAGGTIVRCRKIRPSRLRGAEVGVTGCVPLA